MVYRLHVTLSAEMLPDSLTQRKPRRTNIVHYLKSPCARLSSGGEAKKIQSKIQRKTNITVTRDCLVPDYRKQEAEKAKTWFDDLRYFVADSECREILLYFDLRPGLKCHSRSCTGRKWHILMAVMRGNRVGGNWLMKWDELKKNHDTLIDWRIGREWPLNCMTVISTWWRLNMRFQRSSGRSSGRGTIILLSQDGNWVPVPIEFDGQLQ